MTEYEKDQIVYARVEGAILIQKIDSVEMCGNTTILHFTDGTNTQAWNVSDTMSKAVASYLDFNVVDRTGRV